MGPSSIFNIKNVRGDTFKRSVLLSAPFVASLPKDNVLHGELLENAAGTAYKCGGAE